MFHYFYFVELFFPLFSVHLHIIYFFSPCVFQFFFVLVHLFCSWCFLPFFAFPICGLQLLVIEAQLCLSTCLPLYILHLGPFMLIRNK